MNSEEPAEESVKEEDDAPKTIDETDNTLWVASVAEVRAENPWNVWVRIEWFYRPDELPGGRLPYHGKREIIKSNVQDIISAHTVAGHADVTHWNEMDDSQDADGIDGLFWRQTFDPYAGKLSVSWLVISANCQEPRRHCICRKPYNPDTTMFWCDKCKIWEHEKCLVTAIKKEYINSSQPTSADGKPRHSSGRKLNVTISTDEVTGAVTAYIKDNDRKGQGETAADGDTKAKTETGGSDGKMAIAVKCLKCGSSLR